jgi:glucose-6-phosphate dehydrogenase assembly protein OpcA
MLRFAQHDGAATMIGDDVRVDTASIEKSLASQWRNEKSEGDGAVTRAALWNVVAHAWTSEQQSQASETLARASESVPQRTIVVRSNPGGTAQMASWISANCHLVGKNQQVCSEEVVILADGERVHHIAPLVSALLLPDMPVAVWWLGDLPGDQESYVAPLLDPADRLIVDSREFNDPEDLALVSRIAEETTTAPADLNWVRLEEWRAATASLFDPAPMRERLRDVREVRIVCGEGKTFGAAAEGLLYAAWLTVQSGTDVAFDIQTVAPKRGIELIELRFGDGSTAALTRDRERGVVIAGGDAHLLDCITRLQSRGLSDLIVRQLKRPEIDRVYVKTLRVARELGKRVG